MKYSIYASALEIQSINEIIKINKKQNKIRMLLDSIYQINFGLTLQYQSFKLIKKKLPLPVVT